MCSIGEDNKLIRHLEDAVSSDDDFDALFCNHQVSLHHTCMFME